MVKILKDLVFYAGMITLYFITLFILIVIDVVKLSIRYFEMVELWSKDEERWKHVVYYFKKKDI